jgi:hypothetical protein
MQRRAGAQALLSSRRTLKTAYRIGAHVQLSDDVPVSSIYRFSPTVRGVHGRPV